MSQPPKNMGVFIGQQLIRKGVRIFRETTTHYSCFCPFQGGHDVHTASLSIRKSDGKFNCFGCPAKGASWNTLAKMLNADTLSDEEMPDPFGLFKDDLKEKRAKSQVVPYLPWDIEPWTKRWRKVSPYTMNAATAYHWYDDKKRCDRVLLPIWMYGELVGWTARRLDKVDDMKYREMTGFNKLDALYPWFLVEQMNVSSIALVEGPYDALRLLDEDIPALSNLGSLTNWSKDKAIHLINLGVTRVVIAADGDSAGDKFRDQAEEDLKHMFEIDHYYCPRKSDPGALPSKKHYRKLSRLVNGN